MFTVFGNRRFLRHHTQALKQNALVKAHEAKENYSVANVNCVPRSQVPKDANFIGSQTIYKIKANNDESLKLKACIASHGNEEFDKENLHNVLCMYLPLVFFALSYLQLPFENGFVFVQKPKQPSCTPVCLNVMFMFIHR